ncbi:unnamed protein product, partial [Staurois parvus]
MQTASTNICERMGRSQELSEFKHGTMISCHLCNKSIREISSLLNIPQSTVCGIITRWKQVGTTVTQPQTGRTRKKCVEVADCLQSQLLKTSKLHVAFILAPQCIESFMERVYMAEELNPSPTSPSAMQSTRCSHSSVDVFCGVMNHASLSGNPMCLGSVVASVPSVK